jgi:hypothetical protein
MTDLEFLDAFEQQRLQHFSHYAHLRMAWLYLSKYGWDDGLSRIRKGIQDFAAHYASQKYHETMTLFWAQLVYYAITKAPNKSKFSEFIELYPHLLDSSLHVRHYSCDVLQSEIARREWVTPDLVELPA